METSPAPWIGALGTPTTRCEAMVEPLDLGQLEQRSYASEWSIAQVLSHLGSQAEIFGLLLDASLSGEEPPGREVFGPIWDTWNARSPQAQAADALQADQAPLERFESLDADQLAGLHLQLFGMDLDTAGLARMRLGEHAVHTWDVAVALDPAATVEPDAVGLLIDTLGQLVGQERQAGRETAQAAGDDHRPGAALHPRDRRGRDAHAGRRRRAGLPELRLPAEALIRLVYGRLDPAHTPPCHVSGVDLDELRPIFPGFWRPGAPRWCR